MRHLGEEALLLKETMKSRNISWKDVNKSVNGKKMEVHFIAKGKEGIEKIKASEIAEHFYKYIVSDKDREYITCDDFTIKYNKLVIAAEELIETSAEIEMLIEEALCLIYQAKLERETELLDVLDLERKSRANLDLIKYAKTRLKMQ